MNDNQKTKKSNAKKVLLVGLGVAALTAGAIWGVKNKDSISKMYGNLKKLMNNDKMSVTKKLVHNTAELIKSSEETLAEYSNNLTGEMATPTKLAELVYLPLSPQMINRRLCDNGLQVKQINGTYALTEKGKIFGKIMFKMKYGHPFSNIEWDTSVIKLIFSDEELKTLTEKSANLYEVLNEIKNDLYKTA